MKRYTEYEVTLKPKMDPEREIACPVDEATVIVFTENIESAMIHAWEAMRLNPDDYEIVSVNMGHHRRYEKAF